MITAIDGDGDGAVDDVNIAVGDNAIQLLNTAVGAIGSSDFIFG